MEAEQVRNSHFQTARRLLGEVRRNVVLARCNAPVTWKGDTEQALLAIAKACDEINKLQDNWDKRYLRERNERWKA